MAAGDGTPPRKRAPRKAAAKSQPAKPRKRSAEVRAKAPAATGADRAAAREQMGRVVPIKRSERPGSPTGARNRGARSVTSAQALAIEARRERALNYRRLGLTWAQVAQRVTTDGQARHVEGPHGRPLPNPLHGHVPPSYDGSQAYKDATHLLDTVTIEAVAGVREEDLAMLMALQRKVYPAALDGDLGAVDRMLRIIERRGRILGYESPIRHELAGAGGGAIALTAAAPEVIYEAAAQALDDTLPYVPPPELPSAPR